MALSAQHYLVQATRPHHPVYTAGLLQDGRGIETITGPSFSLVNYSHRRVASAALTCRIAIDDANGRLGLPDDIYLILAAQPLYKSHPQ